MIGIIDYGAGNLYSVRNALEHLGFKSLIIKKPSDIRLVDRLILPGVGAFGSAVKRLIHSGLFGKIYDWLKEDRPFLGICLGMQLLFESSEESKNAKGFGIFSGRIKRFRDCKFPQIGWNGVRVLRKSGIIDRSKKLTYFYFLHGYYVDTPQTSLVVGVTEYGVEYPSIVNRGNVYGVQFHPEKSGKEGLKLLKSWVERC
ncbi:MAG: imidazole glycerol phosphate synthase subunit HisH [candidate division WOR-3 bacterium]|nr:imidazole glycerol phosphate synthase subunit HisH [candidate division WOR-3 bacterium]